MFPTTRSDDFTKKCHQTLKIHTCGHRTYTRPRLTHLGICVLAPQSTIRCTNMASKVRAISMDTPCTRCMPKKTGISADPFDVLMKRAAEDKEAKERIARNVKARQDALKKAEMTRKSVDKAPEENMRDNSVVMQEVKHETSLFKVDTVDIVQGQASAHSEEKSATTEEQKAETPSSLGRRSLMSSIFSTIVGHPNASGTSKKELHMPPRPGSPYSEPSSHWSKDSSDQEDEGWKILTGREKMNDMELSTGTGDWVHLK